ncbi:MAG: hypothetical protein M0Z71_00910 [Nitrospiraceae bacterium]|nr:hypothetical protein [Nitrospiraceae bacterium]
MTTGKKKSKEVETARSMGRITVPKVYITRPTQEEGFMIVARDLLQAVEALSLLPPTVSPRGCALLAGHALECALKAFLWHEGKNKRGHNLQDLWNAAHKARLNIPQEPPDWCKVLSVGHGPIYYFRYQEAGKGVIAHGGDTPALIPLAKELKKLIKLVGQAIER